MRLIWDPKYSYFYLDKANAICVMHSIRKSSRKMRNFQHECRNPIRI